MSDIEIKQPVSEAGQHPIRELTDDLLELIAKLALLGFLVYWSIVLMRPFIPIVLWSLIFTVTLYPAFEWLALRLGGRKRLAAAIIVALGILVLAGPAVWLGLSMMEGFGRLSERLSSGAITIPQPPDEIKTWPLIGDRLYRLWALASTNLKDAITEALPYLKPLKDAALKMAQSAVTAIPIFLISLLIAGFLFPPAPSMLKAVRMALQRVIPSRGQEFVSLAGATIRNVSQGVIGIALLQAVVAGAGFAVAGVPGSGILAFAVLILGIMQVSGIVLISVIIWSWTAMPATAALALTAYLVPVSLIDNVLRPIVIARGLKTPVIVIFIGVFGGAVAHGIIGLFLGPIVLAVTWELIVAWVRREEASPPPGPVEL